MHRHFHRYAAAMLLTCSSSRCGTGATAFDRALGGHHQIKEIETHTHTHTDTHTCDRVGEHSVVVTNVRLINKRSDLCVCGAPTSALPRPAAPSERRGGTPQRGEAWRGTARHAPIRAHRRVWGGNGRDSRGWRRSEAPKGWCGVCDAASAGGMAASARACRARARRAVREIKLRRPNSAKTRRDEILAHE